MSKIATKDQLTERQRIVVYLKHDALSGSMFSAEAQYVLTVVAEQIEKGAHWNWINGIDDKGLLP